MKKSCLILVALLLVSSVAFAANFSPTTLTLLAPDIVHYDFDGTELEIPVTITGKQATGVFMVYTKDMASNIKQVHNGHLGWHYVNNIDTCVYMSSVFEMNQGANTVSWEGKDADGNMAPSGEYTYYLWGYDAVTPRMLACKFFGPKSNQAGFIQQHDVDNNPLTTPIYYPPAGAITQIGKDDGGYDGSENPGIKTRAKWVLGNDPLDQSLIETTTFMGWNDHGKIAFMPGDHNYFFVQNYIAKAVISGGQQIVMKWKWAPNGQSEQDLDFGDGGNWTVANTSGGYAGPISDNVSNLWIVIGDNSYPDSSNPASMYYLDPETGSQLREYDFTWLWWDPTEVDRAINQLQLKYHGGPTMANYMNGRMYCAGLSFCLKHCVDPNQDDDDDVTLWYNGNGDYVGDRYFEEDRGETAWLCSAGSAAPWVYDYTADNNGFSIFSAYDLGALSMGVMAPDGTGVGYFALPSEVASLKYGQLTVDNGGAYDGLYGDFPNDPDNKAGLWYVANDSFKGTITAAPVVVEDASPAAFTVAQNSPNPFNPTTTINFTIPDAGIVTIDVFNAAGQKIDTIVNDYMEAGTHSTVWSASDYSAGVYFYTVKSGDFSKTMKMTLLK
ncbi:MAG: T9SS type A sorting domain-containing protein [Candidatus Latescibacteria bacterium]|nr:T9SS type A sorting domain-containing protein [Candidatus Latescibacterota bacterium]